MTKASPGLIDSLLQPTFMFFIIMGVGPNSEPQCWTTPLASFTSKYNCGCG